MISNYEQAVRKADMAQPELAKAYAILALVDVLREQKVSTVPAGVLKGVQRPPWSQQ